MYIYMYATNHQGTMMLDKWSCNVGSRDSFFFILFLFFPLSFVFFSGDSALTCKGLCKVLWNLEADIADDYPIFITGDPVTLGCWEPEMAILLSPCTECANLWKTEITVFSYKQTGHIQSFPGKWNSKSSWNCSFFL